MKNGHENSSTPESNPNDSNLDGSQNKNDYFVVGDRKVTIEPIDDVIVVKYKKSLQDFARAKAAFNFTDKIEGANIKSYPKYNMTIVSVARSKDVSSDSTAIAKSINEDDNVEFVSKAYREKETGKMLIPQDDINVQFQERCQ